jgi:hypothetical protein
MITGFRWVAVAASCLVWLGLAGCGTANVNPATPRAHTGYVDFYTDTDAGLSWQVKRVDERNGKLHTLYNAFDPVQGTILRLASPPGTQKFQVWFTNEVTEGPQTVTVQVVAGQVTPVHVTLTPRGMAVVQNKSYTYRRRAIALGGTTKLSTDRDTVYQISVLAEAPQAYQVKAKMPYWAQAEK